LLSPGIVALNGYSYDPRRLIAEVYDDPEPSLQIEMLAVEALPVWARI
jgi:hypothetical protein